MANTETGKGEWHDWVGELFEPVFGATIEDLVAHEEEPDNKPKVCQQGLFSGEICRDLLFLGHKKLIENNYMEGSGSATIK